MSDLHDLLYGDQDLDRFLGLAAPDGPFVELCARAKQHRDAGDLDEARQRLREAVLLPGLESRALMVGWTALRALGVAAPDDDPLFGVVLDVPLADGLDTLAAYSDLSARYFNLGQPAIFYERDGSPLEGELRHVILQARFALGGMPVSSRERPLGAGETRIVGLFASGTRVVDLAIDDVQGSRVGPLFISATQFLESLVAWALAQRKE
jgi:hypothetical protein